MDIEKKVLLLALFKKKENETIKDILDTLVNTRVFSQKIGKNYIKSLRQDGYISQDSLTFLGISTATQINKEFII